MKTSLVGYLLQPGGSFVSKHTRCEIFHFHTAFHAEPLQRKYVEENTVLGQQKVEMCFFHPRCFHLWENEVNVAILALNILSCCSGYIQDHIGSAN